MIHPASGIGEQPETRLPVAIGKPGIPWKARSVAAVFDDDVMMAMVTRHRGRDHDAAVAMVPSAVVVECHFAVVATMEALSVPIDDHAVVVVVPVVMMSMVGGDDYVLSGSHGRCGQAKRYRTKDDGFHYQFSKNLRRPSSGKHPDRAFVPALIGSVRWL
jgi:hypothetical protein